MFALSALLYTIGKWSGIVGFFALGLLIFSGDTARWWDKYFGLDRIIKFQRKFSFVVLVFVVLHPVLFMLSSGAVSGFLIPNFAYLPMAMGIIGLYVFLAVMIASSLYKYISYTVWQYIHIATYVLFGMTIFHAVNWGSDAKILSIPYFVITILILIGIVYRTQYKIRRRASTKYTVIANTPETHDTFSLLVENDNPIKFKAGQFCFLRLNGSKLYARHPFTISSAPHDKGLRFTIKDSGRFTSVARRLSAGANVLVDGPFGKFIPPTDKKLVFIAGGVGITPFMSILRDRIHNRCNQSITLLYGSKTIADVIFKKEIDAIDETWFKKVYVVEKSTNTDHSCVNGYITKELISSKIADLNDSLFYICGPEAMKNSAKTSLGELGVSSKSIFVEDFFW